MLYRIRAAVIRIYTVSYKINHKEIHVKKRIITFILASTFSIAHANNLDSSNSWYLGGTVGQSKYDTSKAKIGLSSKFDLDKTDFAYKLFAGYEFSEYFAIEGGYIDLGELSFGYNSQVNEQGFSFQEQRRASAEVDGFIINLVGKLPINDTTHVYAKVGSFSWDVDAKSSYRSIDTISGTQRIFSDSDSEKIDGSDVFYGIGIGYQLNNFTLRAEYEMMESDKQDIDVISIGATYHF